jgi:DNA-binding response OmpR family regulator
MVHLPDHRRPAASSLPPLQVARRARVTWLVLADGAFVIELPTPANDVEVVVADDPGDFQRRLAALRPRLVVCVEPPADHAVLEAVARDRRRRPGMRAVHLSPPEAVTCRLDALAAGFDDALSTTVPVAELAGRLLWLDARAAAARAKETLLPITPDLVLDLEAHALWRGGDQVHLRPKEYALLRLLATNPGRAMSRQELLASVWGPDRSADSRTVDVHVRWLRAKIEPDPDRAMQLVTVRGVGYRFDPPR